MESMNYLVTGANSGLGRAMALGLAKTGATVTMLCRDPQRGRKARIDLIARSGNPNIDLMICDLSSLEDVYRAADEFKSYHRELHLLANLAGVYYPRKRKSRDGYEYNLATNLLGPFLLTNLLLDLMAGSGSAQIINVSGEGHRTGVIDLRNPGLNGTFSVYDANRQAALARVIWTHELARRLRGTMVTANTFCPGRTRSNLYRHLPSALRLPVNLWYRLFAKSADTAMAPILERTLDAPQPQGSGEYYIDGKPERSVPITYDPATGARLFELCEEKTGFRCPVPVFHEDYWLVH